MRTLEKRSFFLALIAHFCLFMSFSWMGIIPAARLIKLEKQDTPALDIPAYLYQRPERALLASTLPASAAAAPIIPSAAPKTKKSPPISLKKSIIISANPEKLLDLKRTIVLNALNSSNSSNIAPYTEPVHLIGDKKIAKPLLVVLGKALTAHLTYPKSALDFNIKGTAIIGFLLDPSGQVTAIQLLQSSRADVLDKAALVAAESISPVKGVSTYLSKPQFMVIGIIFQ